MISSTGTDAKLRSRRIPFRQVVRVAPRSGDERRSEESLDLSLGGMFLTSMVPLDVVEVLDLEMPLDSIRFTTPALVSWVRLVATSDERPVGMAVKFIELNQHQKRLIHRQVSNHTRAGGQLKIGRPPVVGRNSPSRGTSGPRSTRRQATDHPGGPWLIAGAAAVAIAILLLALLV
jgi:hypothetical protein